VTLPGLDVSNNTALVTLDVGYNQLTGLDVSNNTALTYLEVNNNQLTGLDVSNNTALKFLDVSYNQLTALDVSNNNALEKLDVSNNSLPLSQLYKMMKFESLNCGVQSDVLPAEFSSSELEQGKTYSFASESSFNGINTIFSFFYNRNKAVEGQEFLLQNGKITFNKEGYYQIEMQNDNIFNKGNFGSDVARVKSCVLNVLPARLSASQLQKKSTVARSAINK
jgi:hypothetical protein